MKRPRRRSPTLHDVLSRPVMNGGFDKLARQQDEQCERLERLEDRFNRFERLVKVVAGAVGTVAVSVIGRLVYDLVDRLHIVIR